MSEFTYYWCDACGWDTVRLRDDIKGPRPQGSRVPEISPGAPAMKPVEEIARWINDRKCRGSNNPDEHGCPAPDECECEMLDAIATALRAERERAEKAEADLERDRTLVAVALNKTKAAIAGRAWLLEGGRGPYSWDDDRFRAEFGYALEEIDQPLKDLAKIARDWTNCPTDPDAIASARTDWKARAQKAEAERDEARAALAPFVAQLADIGEDESDADTFRMMSANYARAPRLTVGDFRRLRGVPNALATARNRALEEAAEEIRPKSNRALWGGVESAFDRAADRILALRTEEPE